MSLGKQNRLIIPQPGPKPRESEAASGLWLCRRSFIACCSVGLATQAFLGAARTFAQSSGYGFDEFLAAANAIAAELIEDRSRAGQDRYLRSLSARAAGLDDVPLPDTWRDSGQSNGPGTFIGVNPGGVGFVVLHWRLEPNTRILPHAHTYGNVVTVGLEGAVRVRNYEVVGDRDYTSDADFVVRNTVDQHLTAGDTNLVSLERNYVHGFDASRGGARGLDITTRLLPRPDYGYLLLGDDTDSSDGSREYVGRWDRR